MEITRRDDVKIYAISLLSLIPLSCIVVSRRELVNTLNHSTSKPQAINQLLFKQYLMDIKFKLPRRCSLLPSINSLRKMSTSSTAFLMNYAKHMQAQLKKLTWAKQVKNRDMKDFSLLIIHHLPQVWNL